MTTGHLPRLSFFKLKKKKFYFPSSSYPKAPSILSGLLT